MEIEYRYSSPYFKICLMTMVLYSPSFRGSVSKYRLPFPLTANEMWSLYELGLNLTIGILLPGLQQLPPSVIRVTELQPLTFLTGLISTLKMNSFLTTGTSAILLFLVGLNSKKDFNKNVYQTKTRLRTWKKFILEIVYCFLLANSKFITCFKDKHDSLFRLFIILTDIVITFTYLKFFNTIL